jgi:hypothetical protein
MCHALKQRHSKGATGTASRLRNRHSAVLPTAWRAVFRGPSFLAVGALVAVSILSARALPVESDGIMPTSDPLQTGESLQDFEARRENEMRAAQLLGASDVYPHKYIFVGGGHHR